MSISEVQGAGTAAKPVRELDTVVVRFVGDSGDGMQITGTQFTNASALAGERHQHASGFPRRDPRTRRHLAG